MSNPGQPTSAVNELADRFWEAHPRAVADDGDGLRRRALRRPPARPGPGGPRQGAPARRGHPGRGGRDRHGRPLGRGAHHPRHGQGHLRPHHRARTTSASTVIKVVDQLEGPQQTLPVITQFQPADSPDRLEQFLARLRAYPAFMAANADLLHEGLTSGMTASRISTERTIAQLERMLAVPPEESVIVQTARVAGDAERERCPRGIVREVGLSRPTSCSSTPCVASTAMRAARSRGSGRRPTATSSIGPRSSPGPRSSSTRRTCTRSASTSSRRSRHERRKIARTAGFGDDTVAYRRHLGSDPANIPTSRDADPGARSRGHRAGPCGSAAATSAGSRALAAPSAPSRSTRRPTRRSPTTTRPRSTAPGRASTT